MCVQESWSLALFEHKTVVSMKSFEMVSWNHKRVFSTALCRTLCAQIRSEHGQD